MSFGIVSIVVPCYRSEKSLPELIDRLLGNVPSSTWVLAATLNFRTSRHCSSSDPRKSERPVRSLFRRYFVGATRSWSPV